MKPMTSPGRTSKEMSLTAQNVSSSARRRVDTGREAGKGTPASTTNRRAERRAARLMGDPVVLADPLDRNREIAHRMSTTVRSVLRNTYTPLDQHQRRSTRLASQNDGPGAAPLPSSAHRKPWMMALIGFNWYTTRAGAGTRLTG